MNDPIERQAAIDEALLFLVEYCGAAFDEDMQNMLYQRLKQLPSAQPEPQNDSDRIYAMMKDYYFEHKDEHDVSWQGGFGKCMNLIPNVIEKKTQPDLTADQIFTMKEQEYCRGYEDGRKVERELRNDQSEVHYCDRDICLRNDYNGIGCRDCEVTKSQQSRR